MGSAIEIGVKSRNHHVVFFDGVCNLCNGFVNFLIDRDSRNQLMFASLQSEEAKSLLPSDITSALDSVVLLTPDGSIYRESDAVLEIARLIGGIYGGLTFFKVLPRSFRDGVYRWVARNRYRWFGRQDVCRVPTTELKAKFL